MDRTSWLLFITPANNMLLQLDDYDYELLSKLLVSPLITPIVLLYITPYISPFKEFRP